MAPIRSGRLRGLAVNLALAALSVAVVFGAVEAVLRVTGLAPARALRSPDLETLEAIPGLYDPGQELTDRVRRDLPCRIRINNLGFRGRDLPEDKGPGILRIMVLGDSYTFGDHVDTEQAWPARLESLLQKRLASRPPAGPPGDGEVVSFEAGVGGTAPPLERPSAVEVVNAGANGFGLVDMEILWEKAGPRLKPDAVIITFSPNDISDLTRSVPMIRQMRANAALKSKPLLGPLLRLLQGTAVFNGMQILRARMKGAARDHDTVPSLDPARAGPDAAPKVWESYRRALERLAGTLRRSGRRALLVLYPSHPHVAGEEPFHAGRILPAWGREAGLQVLDLLPALREAAGGGDKLYLVPRDSHPSPEGHRVAARAVAEEIDRLGWLGDREAP